MVKHHKLLLLLSLISYLLVCVWIYYFKCNLINDLRFLCWDIGIYWIPFGDVFTKDGFSFADFSLQVLNVIGFIPVGFLFSANIKKKPLLVGVIGGFIFSFLIEAMQLILKFGSPQLGDLLMNTLGAFIGAFVFIKVKDKLAIKTQSLLCIVFIIICLCLIVIGFIFTLKMWPTYTDCNF